MTMAHFSPSVDRDSNARGVAKDDVVKISDTDQLNCMLIDCWAQLSRDTTH